LKCVFTILTISEQKMNNTLKPPRPEKPLSVNDKKLLYMERIPNTNCYTPVRYGTLSEFLQQSEIGVSDDGGAVTSYGK